ncbi:hypothetical protein MYAER_4122 [Microcystis aeruginosa NIES-2549]|uniref:Uncharacterized protein n=1 Tax=Microcystis aeruginosa NIES-2549 TaxID=1641812 RepID=A0A0F6U7S4_MICAE|nr:hypothetical protein [Microcystis aeruginosa]AKE66446.1 hypothetical protein MYAER_4122 [Microcystis aeruginosa NIES-2549]AOC54853.1 hypothetical protein amyaer_4170 [Microcystis aeruginosa NIES-2481]
MDSIPDPSGGTILTTLTGGFSQSSRSMTHLWGSVLVIYGF